MLGFDKNATPNEKDINEAFDKTRDDLRHMYHPVPDSQGLWSFWQWFSALTGEYSPDMYKNYLVKLKSLHNAYEDMMNEMSESFEFPKWAKGKFLDSIDKNKSEVPIWHQEKCSM